MRKTRTKLNLLSLENRLAPNASLVFQGGNLTVTGDNTSNTIAITGTQGAIQVFVAPGDQFPGWPGNYGAITSPANSRGVYNVTGKITVNGGNSDDFVVFVVDDLGTLPGDVFINMGNGNDATIFNTATNVRATVAGRLTWNGGLGADNLFIDDFNLQGIVSVVGGGSGFRDIDPGPGVVLNPNDVLEFRDTEVFNLMTVNNAVTFLGQISPVFPPSPGPGTVIHGNLIVQNNVANPLGKYTIDGEATFVNYSGVLAIGSLSRVDGSVTYAGSTSKDAVLNLGVISGGLTMVGYGGDDSFGIGGGNILAPGTVNGNISYTGSNGADNISLFDGSFVGGSANFYMGDGTNTYDLAHTFTVNGSFGITAGNGTDFVGNVGTGQFVGGAFIGGTQNYNLGNGANTVIWNATAAAGLVTYTGGGGVDSVRFNGTNAFGINVSLASGDDFFEYGTGASVGSAFLDGGTGNDGYGQLPNVPVVTWNQTLLNFDFGFIPAPRASRSIKIVELP